MTAPGWYNAEGDPPGTTRYWDGSQWVGDPVHTPPVSPGAVAGPVRADQLATAGSRMGARAIDFIIVTVISLIILAPMFSDIFDTVDRLGPLATNAQVQSAVEDVIADSAANLLLALGLGFVWEWLWIGLVGATPGKLMLGLRVADGQSGTTPPGLAKGALRALNRAMVVLTVVSTALGNVLGLVALLIGVVSLIMLFTDDRRRTVMDRVAGTVVRRK